MCPPEHFVVEYAINPWMDTSTPVDTELAVKQWTRLRELLVEHGHTVHELSPEPGLPDMVFAANGAFSVGGAVYGARFRYPQRSAEALVHQQFYATDPAWRFHLPSQVNEGEGDFAYARRTRSPSASTWSATVATCSCRPRRPGWRRSWPRPGTSRSRSSWAS